MSTIKFFKTLLLMCAMLSFTWVANAQFTADNEDQKAVYAAIEDYVLGLYEVAPERIARSVDTSLYKIGYYEYNSKSYDNALMTYEQLYSLSARWNKNGDQVDEDTPRKIEIYQVHDKTAAAKLTAKWGIDFMHLSKNKDGKWMIYGMLPRKGGDREFDALLEVLGIGRN